MLHLVMQEQIFLQINNVSIFQKIKTKTCLNNGYNKNFLNQSLHSMLSLPFFLFLMTALASTLTLNTLKKSDNFKFIIIGILITILMFYFKVIIFANKSNTPKGKCRRTIIWSSSRSASVSEWMLKKGSVKRRHVPSTKSPRSHKHCMVLKVNSMRSNNTKRRQR